VRYFTAKEEGRQEGYWPLAIGHWLECIKVQLVLLPQRPAFAKACASAKASATRGWLAKKEDAEIAQRLGIRHTTYRLKIKLEKLKK
jgi:hypothetical protein